MMKEQKKNKKTLFRPLRSDTAAAPDARRVLTPVFHLRRLLHYQSDESGQLFITDLLA